MDRGTRGADLRSAGSASSGRGVHCGEADRAGDGLADGTGGSVTGRPEVCSTSKQLASSSPQTEDPELEQLIEAGLAGPFKALTAGTWRRIRREGRALGHGHS